MSFTDPIAELSPGAEGYDELGLTLDVSALTELALQYFREVIPNYEDHEGNAEVILAEAIAQIAGDLSQQAATVPPEAMIYLGETVFNIPINAGNTAVGDMTIVFTADVGAITILADTLFTVPHPSGENMMFSTDRDIIATPSGSFDLIAVATETGEIYNGAFGDADFLEPIDGIESAIVQQTAGGEDIETATDYLNRLSQLLTVLSPRPILPSDFVTIAKQVPGVGRATVLDLYQPGTDDNNATLGLVVEGTPVL